MFVLGCGLVWGARAGMLAGCAGACLRRAMRCSAKRALPVPGCVARRGAGYARAATRPLKTGGLRRSAAGAPACGHALARRRPRLSVANDASPGGDQPAHAAKGSLGATRAPARPVRSGSGGRAGACPRSRDRGGRGGAASEVVRAPRASGLREPERGRGIPVRAGHWGEMPQRTGWLEKTAGSVRTVLSGLPGAHWQLDSAHPDRRRAPAAGLGSCRPPARACGWTRLMQCAQQYHSAHYNSLRVKNIPAAGGVLPLAVRTGWGLPAGGSRSTGSRSAAGGSSDAERVVLRRYGGRLAASGTTRLRPDRYSWKAEGEARGHLRTDTLYNA
ncbi:hypothetical protein A4R44_03212 [Amycolatopsis sp. M39]|nr:hypothetical protein A4R44_03212 [Amycolatopsis sp. M39]